MGAGAAALASVARMLNLTPQRVFVVNQTGGAAGGGLVDKLFTGGRDYETAMRASRMGRFGMSRALGASGAGLGAVAGIAGGLMMQSENEGMQVGGAALSGAGTGAMIGSFIPGIGTAVGAGLGAAIGGLTAYLSKKDKEEEKSKETSNEKYDQMIKLLQTQSEKDTRIFMDSNQVGIGLALGNPRLN